MSSPDLGFGLRDDTGSGIEPEALSKIFEAYYTTKEKGKGTGLGLAMVQKTMIEHHGAVTVSSRVGEGTTFEIYLPVVD